MCARPYDTLAHVYEWLIPDDLLTAAGSAAVFAPLLEPLGRPARILDCAAGGGQLAVGLAAMGFDVVASDASAGMIARTQALAAEHNVALSARVCSWDELPAQGLGRFDAIFCVGNSLVHAPRQAGRQSALAAMASVLRHQGLLVLTSRNWEQVRNQGSGIEVSDRMIERHAGPASSSTPGQCLTAGNSPTTSTSPSPSSITRPPLQPNPSDSPFGPSPPTRSSRICAPLGSRRLAAPTPPLPIDTSSPPTSPRPPAPPPQPRRTITDEGRERHQPEQQSSPDPATCS